MIDLEAARAATDAGATSAWVKTFGAASWAAAMAVIGGHTPPVAPSATYEVYDNADDRGVGTGHRIEMVAGQLVPADDVAAGVLQARRLFAGLPSDRVLAGEIDGWNNGAVGIRKVPRGR